MPPEKKNSSEVLNYVLSKLAFFSYSLVEWICLKFLQFEIFNTHKVKHSIMCKFR